VNIKYAQYGMSRSEVSLLTSSGHGILTYICIALYIFRMYSFGEQNRLLNITSSGDVIQKFRLNSNNTILQKINEKVTINIFDNNINNINAKTLNDFSSKGWT